MIETSSATAPKITKLQREILQHSLGGKSRYRNYFATHEEGKDYEAIAEMVEMGLMERGRAWPAEMGGMVYFHVTRAGITQAFKEP